MADDLGIIRAPSALSTGGSGFRFEDLVGAFVVTGLLAGDSPVPGLGVPRLVGFQERALGQTLDDISILGADDRRRWFASIKSYDLIPGGRLDGEFVEEAWQQMLSGRFDVDRDHVGFVCAGSGEVDWRNLLSLIETARTDVPERLAARIGVVGAFNDTHRTLWESARCPAALHHALPVKPDASAALLLGRLIPLRLDLVLPDGDSARQAQRWCEQALATGHAEVGRPLWDAVLALVARVRTRGGAIEWGLLSRELGDRFALAQRPDARPDWAICDRHSAERVGAVRGTLAEGLALPRAAAHAALAEVGDAPFIYLTGDSGTGKTVLARSWLQAGLGDRLWLSAGDLVDGLSGFAARHRLRLSVPEVLSLGSSPVRVVVDGLDRIAEAEAAGAVAALARLAAGSVGAIQLMVTCQSFALERVVRSVLSAAGPSHQTVVVGDLDDDDLRLLLQQRPALRRLAGQGRLQGVLRRAKLLEVLIDAMVTAGERPVAAVGDESGVAGLWWDALALGDEQRAARAEFLIGLAGRQGDELSGATPTGRLGALAPLVGAADALRADAVLSSDEAAYGFAHDLFGDWSRLQALGGWGDGAAEVIAQKALLPTWQRAIRLFALRTLGADRDAWTAQHAALREAGHTIAADLFLEAPLLSVDAERQLEAIWPALVQGDRPLLGRMLTRFLHVGSVPDPTAALFASCEQPELQTYIEAMWRVPIWVLWPPVIRALGAHPTDALGAAPLQVAEIVDRWLRAPYRRLPARDVAARLGLAIGQLGDTDLPGGRYHDRDDRIKLWRAFLAAGVELPGEVTAVTVAAFAEAAQAEAAEERW